MKQLLVEGWRLIPHSYAMVNQFQCLEILLRSDIALYHDDAPFFMDHWATSPGLFTPADEAKLRAIPPSHDGAHPGTFDAVLRMTVPYRIQPAPNARRTFVFGTAEFGVVSEMAFGDGIAPERALREADVDFITPSAWSREGFLRSGAAAERVHVVPHGVRTDVWKPLDDDARSELRMRMGFEGKFVFLHVGAMTVNKGIGHLMKAFAEIMARYPNALLVLKGSDALFRSQTALQEMLGTISSDDSAKILSRTAYLGETISNVRMAEFYQAADAYVSPYLAEGFNLPVLEAVASGLPVVCTRGGPTDEFTRPSFTKYIDSRLTPSGDRGGYRLEPDVAHLVELMEQTMADDGFRARAKVVGPAFARSAFTWKHAVDKLVGVLFEGEPRDGASS